MRRMIGSLLGEFLCIERPDSHLLLFSLKSSFILELRQKWRPVIFLPLRWFHVGFPETEM